MIDHYKILLPQTIKAHSLDQNLHIQLCVVLSNAYIDLNGDPKKARNMLKELLAEQKEKTIDPHLEAKIHLGLGKVYRYAALGNECDYALFLNISAIICCTCTVCVTLVLGLICTVIAVPFSCY